MFVTIGYRSFAMSKITGLPPAIYFVINLDTINRCVTTVGRFTLLPVGMKYYKKSIAISNTDPEIVDPLNTLFIKRSSIILILIDNTKIEGI